MDACRTNGFVFILAMSFLGSVSEARLAAEPEVVSAETRT